MIKYFKIVEITEQEFKNQTGTNIGTYVQISVECDDCVLSAINTDYADELNVPIDSFCDNI